MLISLRICVDVSIWQCFFCLFYSQVNSSSWWPELPDNRTVDMKTTRNHSVTCNMHVTKKKIVQHFIRRRKTRLATKTSWSSQLAAWQWKDSRSQSASDASMMKQPQRCMRQDDCMFVTRLNNCTVVSRTSWSRDVFHPTLHKNMHSTKHHTMTIIFRNT